MGVFLSGCFKGKGFGERRIAAEEQFFDQRLKSVRPLDRRYNFEVHNKATERWVLGLWA